MRIPITNSLSVSPSSSTINLLLAFKSGPEFGPLQGHLLLIQRALYGLRTSGVCWNDRLSDVLRDMRYFQSKADPDLLIIGCDTHYEYVLIYVDDLMCIGRNSQAFYDALIYTYHFKLKGVGPSFVTQMVNLHGELDPMSRK
jgi:Reverse transcriptase (RNA-dependent DNA polymerase)